MADSLGGEQQPQTVNVAADQLVDRLRRLAEEISATVTPRRVKIGKRAWYRPADHSPAGFILVDRGPGGRHTEFQLLLPDGRLWEYSSRFDKVRAPEGRFIDLHARRPPLLAELSGYLFVDNAGELAAKTHTDGTYRFVDLDEAFDAIAAEVIRRHGGPTAG